MRLLPSVALAVGFVGCASAQTPQFEVATIRQATANGRGGISLGMKIDASRVIFTSVPIQAVVTQAFGVKPYQLQMPEQAGQIYDISATIPNGAPVSQVPEMLKNLLIERFGMKYHREAKEREVYLLTQGKPPLKIVEVKPTESDPNAPDLDVKGPTGGGGRGQGMGGLAPGTTVSLKGGGGILGVMAPGVNNVKVSLGNEGIQFDAETSMEGLANLLSEMVNRPVIDQTNLKGTYRVVLELSMLDMAAAIGAGRGGGRGDGGRGGAAVAADPGGAGSIVERVQKLGLKLDAKKAPIDTVVIDKLDSKPTDN